jgi:hypothetical protein
VEIYIDDIVVKSKGHQEYLADLRKALECTRKHGLKMNPNKCAFGVSADQFLGFMVHERGIEISQKTITAINKVVAPETKVKLESLIGKINFIWRFIANLSGKIQLFTSLLKLKADQKFVWGEAQQKALDEIKQYLTSPLCWFHRKSTSRLNYIYRLTSVLSDRPLFKSSEEKNV